MRIAGWVKYKDGRNGTDSAWLPVIFLTHVLSTIEEVVSGLMRQGR